MIYTGCFQIINLQIKEMIKLIIECILLGFFIAGTFGGLAQVLYNLEQKKVSSSSLWLMPAVIFMIFWFIHIYFKY